MQNSRENTTAAPCTSKNKRASIVVGYLAVQHLPNRRVSSLSPLAVVGRSVQPQRPGDTLGHPAPGSSFNMHSLRGEQLTSGHSRATTSASRYSFQSDVGRGPYQGEGLVRPRSAR
eukprot:scaffold1439_cov404-Prasinococcus_capsulatus_cf.AAC.11